MDAQNAAEATSAKPVASSTSTSASSTRPASDPDRVKAAVKKSPTIPRLPLPTASREARAAKDGTESREPKESKEFKEPKEHKESRDVRDTRDNRDARDNKDAKSAPRDSASALTPASTSTSAKSAPSAAVVSSSSTLGSHSSKETPKSAPRTTALSPPPKDARTTGAASPRDKQDDESGGTDGISEAETIVLSKDGSPAKPHSRKLIKHEDKQNGDAASSQSQPDAATSIRKHLADKKDPHSDKGEKATATTVDGTASADAAAILQKKRRMQERQERERQDRKDVHDRPERHERQERQHASNHRPLSRPRAKDASSSLSSAPASPPRSRQHSSNPYSGSESERGRAPPRSPKRISSNSKDSKDRLRPPEKLVPNKRKAPKADSDDEIENRKARRQRLAATAGSATVVGSHLSTGKNGRDQSHSSNGNHNHRGVTPSSARAQTEAAHNRSLSPQAPRSHRRSLSTQLPSQSSSLSMKKKRVPAPLQPTDYHSDDSSTSGSPHIRGSKVRSLDTPGTAESAMSAGKGGGSHKKHLDAHGQTVLARACAKGECSLVRQRLKERPQDLDMADFAGNTPLQIAAINGYGDVVKLLIEAGCQLDCVNHEKDTPLLDAVDNGHLEVVRLLLNAGVNPRKANVNGEEPLDRVSDDIENAAEIRAALIEARKNMGDRRLTSEEQRHEQDEGRLTNGPESPHRTPPPSASHPPASGRRAATVRATKTSNHLLYMPMDDKTLRQAAGRGDEETVTRILQVRDVFDDPESMVAAARGGHDIVMQLLLALGSANPDPAPVSSLPAEHATPMLAAIGQENSNVVRLLLDQTNFNPTQKFRDKTYYEIARQRQGPNWKEEEALLKSAYSKYKKEHGGSDGKTKSPTRKDQEPKRVGRPEPRDDSTPQVHRRKLSSPTRERTKKTVVSKVTAGSNASPKEEKAQKRSSEQTALHGDREASPKRVPVNTGTTSSKPRREERSSNPDHDTPPPPKQAMAKRVDTDSVTVSSEGEQPAKPRRKKLVSGKELKGERERERERDKEREKERERERDREKGKQRRASMVSTNTAPSKEASSPREELVVEKPVSDKHRDRNREKDRDRARQLKKEESRESVSSSGEGPYKRHRLSETPSQPGSSDRDGTEAPSKRRRLDADGKERKASKSSNRATEDAPTKAASLSARETPASSSKPAQKKRDAEERKESASSSSSKKQEGSSDRGHKDKDSTKKPPATSSEKSIHVKSEDVDIEMSDLTHDVVKPGTATAVAQTDSEATVPPAAASVADAAASRTEREDEEEKKSEAEARAAAVEAKKKKEEELHRLQQEEEEKRTREEEKRKREEEKKRREEEAKRKKEEESKKKRELEDKRKAEEAKQIECKRQEEERERERKRKEDEEKRRREEEEKKRREEADREQRKQEEERERKRREEEERLRQTQLAKEAAEEAERKRVEEEGKERERREQERKEHERKEHERKEHERKEHERKEHERKEHERKEHERKEQERVRAEQEAEELRRRQLKEEERIRVAQLPALLRWLSTYPNAKSASLSQKFSLMQGVRYDCLKPSATGSAEGREQWLLNTQVALILGSKDLCLSAYPSWQRIPASHIAKTVIWRLESDRYSLTTPELYDIGSQLPGYYGPEGPEKMGYQLPERLHREAKNMFFATDMFFVKASDVMNVIPTIPHLRDVRLTMAYRELPEDESQLFSWEPLQKWKSDPGADRFLGFAPRYTYYVNGELVKEELPGLGATSKTPFDVRVPRRGFEAVPVDDPDYARLCKEQGMDAAIVAPSPKLRNGVYHSPEPSTAKVNGRASLPHPLNGIGHGRPPSPRPLVNGVNGARSG